MPPESRRYDSVRESTLELLEAGEQPHIEFKSIVVPGAVAKQVAAGANFIAFQPAVRVHTIIFGVAEEDSQGTGATTGSIVGLSSEDGGPADLDALQLQIEQIVHAKVRPQPNLSIYQENVATIPILVVEVRPTSAPHVVDDRWHIRGVGGVRSLTQDEALQIFKNQRLAAWIDEFEESDPLQRALAALRSSIDDLRYERFSDGSALVMDHALASPDANESFLQHLQQSLDGVEAKVDEAIEAIAETLGQATFAADNTTTETAESVWWTVMRSRMMRLHTVHTFASIVGTERVALIDELVSDHLGEAAPFAAYPDNLAESAAYRSLRRAGEDRRLELDAASDLVAAVIWRRNGLPPTFGIDWLNNMKSTPDLSADLQNPLSARRLVGNVQPEVGLLHLPDVAADHVAEVLHGTMSLNRRLLSVRLPIGVYRLAIPESRSVWAVTFSPGTKLDDGATTEMAQAAAAIDQLAAESGGSSWCIEGPGVAIPTR
ncbi:MULTISPECIES: AlbA family DNA-binding domain-containing protein [unclassified Microbacterium]|uniref:AlbA family DNA-binding domain-containing protein n=1 Tax=unclassified Microbacterium TaxID=2609290 RepID=UPI00300F98B9